MANETNKDVELLRDTVSRLEGSLAELRDRFADVEDIVLEELAKEDSGTPDIKRSASPPDVKTMPDLPRPEDAQLLANDIEQGIPKADPTDNFIATIVLRPTEKDGTEYGYADDIRVFIAADRSEQAIGGRRWKATAGSTIGTILSFVRLPVTVTFGGESVDGVLIGEGVEKRLFPVRLIAEASGGGGEYDEWEEVQISDADSWEAGGAERAHDSTDPARSVFEANGREGIYADATYGTIVWVHEEDGDEERYVFDYGMDKVEGGTLSTDPEIIPDTDKGWIYKYTRGGVVEDAHADPRNETVYIPDNDGTNCGVWPAFDARGHVIGWWFLEGGEWINWYSPWGFEDPGGP